MSVRTSITLLLDAQTDAGAIPASTVHEVYRYAWLRDGSWCAHALDLAGHHTAARAWHDWVAATLLRHCHRVEEAIAAVAAGRVEERVMMPARFTLDGHEERPDGDGGEEEVWPNFQTDCYGFWLWAVVHHLRHTDREPDEALRAAMQLVIRYLLVAGELPCFDCWEEYPGQVHTSSLAAVAAGLRDGGTLLGDRAATARAAELVARITGPEHTLAGGLIRFPGDTRVDGSLLWVGVPFALLDADDPLYRTTVKRIREELHVPGGGVRRYQGDSFYGGSQWILLAASLACATAELGEPAPAAELLAWIEAQADEHGHLPEQVADRVQSSHMLHYWRQRWGTTATPLLWSHAMHVLTRHALHQP